MKTLANPIVIASAIIGICAIVASCVYSHNGRYQLVKTNSGFGIVFDTSNGKIFPVHGDMLIDVVKENRKPRK